VALLGNSHFPDFDPSMFERLEVLRGPQGTLYGASSLGGLLKYVTKQPDTHELSGRIEAGFESVQGGTIGWTTRASVNLPMISDTLALRVGAFLREDPAWKDNVPNQDPTITVSPADNVNHAKTYGGHAALLFKPMDGLDITLSALDQRRSAEFYSGEQVNENAAGYPVFSSPIYGYTKISLGPTSDIGHQQLYTGRIEANLPLDMHLTSITAYGKSAGTNFQDVTSVFGGLFSFFYGVPGSVSIADAQETEKFSEELRLAGKISQLDWRVGLFYTRETGSVNQDLFFNGIEPYAGLGPSTYKEKAAFADGTYHITSQWDIQAGVRWAKNEQVIGSGQVIDPVMVPIFGPSGTNPDLHSDDSSTTWAISPTYHITPDVMAYFRAATGYRPGGPNVALPSVPPTFGPDTVTNYELGLKGITDDKSIRYDLALFDIEWRNIQLQDTDAVSQFTYTTNGGKARSRGIEAQVAWSPYKALDISASITYTDATLTESLSGIEGADTLVGAKGDRLPASAKFTSNLSIQQNFPLSNGASAFVGGNWSYIGDRESEFQLSAAGSTPRFSIPSYSLVDLNAGLQWQKWEATLFLRNAFNTKGVITADNRNGTSVTSVNYLQPVSVGMTVSYQF
jgi:outer membrane receptor protein involved in Fe transport